MMRILSMLAPLLLLSVPAAAAQWTPEAARALLQAVDRSAAEGLNPADYEAEALGRALASGDAERIGAVADRAYRMLARDYALGRTPDSARVSWSIAGMPWTAQTAMAWMEAALGNGRIGESLEALLPQHPQYLGLKGALAAMDPADAEGRDLLRVNLDRWRWMPRDPGARHLLVNVPAFEARLVEDGQVTATHRIIVGAAKTPTPQFSAVATGIVMNPPWAVPRSIVRESVGGLIARSPATARARGYRWSGSGSGLAVVQQPGPGNALGQFKIDMPNPYSVFLHDTPAKALFERSRRALSHGCIRTDRIGALADRLLPDWDSMKIAAVLDSRTTMRVPLDRQLPVFIAYFTAAIGPEGQYLQFADVYGRDPPVLAALGKAAQPAQAAAAPAAAPADETRCQAAMPNLPA